jgi:Spy/CpxP family protein refolding chaperone
MTSDTRRPRALAAALLAFTMAFGVVAGIALDRLVLLPAGAEAAVVEPRSGVPERDRPRGRIPGPAADARYLDFMASELDLSPEQRARVEEILRRQQERVQEITRETRPQIRALARETRAAVDSVLTGEQRERMQELRARRDRMHKGAHGPGNGGDGGE